MFESKKPEATNNDSLYSETANFPSFTVELSTYFHFCCYFVVFCSHTQPHINTYTFTITDGKLIQDNPASLSVIAPL